MIKCASFDVVFQEVPGEVTLAINLSLCPNRCKGCHSPHLRSDVGEELTPQLLASLCGRYRSAITCVCFMGGDGDPQQLATLAAQLKRESGGTLKTAWYSGRQELPPRCAAQLLAAFDYIKLGPYMQERGPLSSPGTNQRFYRITPQGTMEDITHRFVKKSPL